MKFFYSMVLFSLVNVASFYGEQKNSAEDSAKTSAVCNSGQAAALDRMQETNHTVSINGVTIPYKATVGTLTVSNDKDEPRAQFFYVAYTRSDTKDLTKRPLTFCFNGGPGSSSVWLHLGAFGPKRVACNDEPVPVRPYHLVSNEYSLLDLTDLVFIDPVATGFSKPTSGQDPKQFFGVNEDIESVSQFIRMYTTKNSRWLSPKIIAGESYGTLRAAGVFSFLQENMFMPIDAVVMVSSVLNFQTLDLGNRYSGNDLPSILALPSYAATAWYHKKAAVNQPLTQFLAQVENFASNEYTTALMQGDRLVGEERVAILRKLSEYTGVSTEFIDCMNLRFDVASFTKEILKADNKIVGRFDSRVEGVDIFPCELDASYDPSFERLVLGYTAAFNEYLKLSLLWDADGEYKILSNVFPWNFEPAVNQYLNLSLSLRDAMTKNLHTKVFVASGYYDLATPYYATDYTFDHMNMNKDIKGNIIKKIYPGGHMMYLNEMNLKKLKEDLSVFYQNALPKSN
jgi:carboxypeptidase C (cathepsin A)